MGCCVEETNFPSDILRLYIILSSLINLFCCISRTPLFKVDLHFHVLYATTNDEASVICKRFQIEISLEDFLFVVVDERSCEWILIRKLKLQLESRRTAICYDSFNHEKLFHEGKQLESNIVQWSHEKI